MGELNISEAEHDYVDCVFYPGVACIIEVFFVGIRALEIFCSSFAHQPAPSSSAILQRMINCMVVIHSPSG